MVSDRTISIPSGDDSNNDDEHKSATTMVSDGTLAHYQYPYRVVKMKSTMTPVMTNYTYLLFENTNS